MPNNVDALEMKSYLAQTTITEYVTSALKGIVPYSASDLGVRLAAQGRGFHIAYDAEGSNHDVYEGEMPPY